MTKITAKSPNLYTGSFIFCLGYNRNKRTNLLPIRAGLIHSLVHSFGDTVAIKLLAAQERECGGEQGMENLK